MTTKDQAITWLPTGPWSKEAEMLESWIANKPEPDCRTCRFSHIGALSKCCDVICTNGDKYQPAPKVVLWRTA